MSRASVRQQLATYLRSGYLTGVNQIFTSFPKRINFQTNAMPGILTRTALVIYIEGENESRIAIGGATSGWKRIDYSMILQVYSHSLQREAELAMSDFDVLLDAIKDWIRADHNLGDPTGTIIWQGAEPAISTTYGVPSTDDSSGATEIQAIMRFTITEMIQA
jgi:hypothetical protein